MFNRKKIKQLNETISDLTKSNEELIAKNQQLSEELNYANTKSDFYEKTSDKRLDKILDEQKAYNSSVNNNLSDVAELEDLQREVIKAIDILARVNPKVRLNAVPNACKILEDALGVPEDIRDDADNIQIFFGKDANVVNRFKPDEAITSIKKDKIDDDVSYTEGN